MQIIFLRVFFSPRMDRYSDLYLTESQIDADGKDSDQTARILWPEYEDE